MKNTSNTTIRFRPIISCLSFSVLLALGLPNFARGDTLYCGGLKIRCEGDSRKCVKLLKRLACNQSPNYLKSEMALREALSEFQGPYKPKPLARPINTQPFFELQSALGMSEGCSKGKIKNCEVKPDPFGLVGALVKVFKFSADTFYTVGETLSGGANQRGRR